MKDPEDILEKSIKKVRSLNKAVKIILYPFVYAGIIFGCLIVGFRWAYDILFFKPKPSNNETDVSN